MQQVKFSVFADLHYRDGNWNSAAERLERVLERAEREKVDFIMHCGDFCHNVMTAKPIINRYNSFHIPAYHTVGNHDFEQTDGLAVVLEAYRLGDRSYYRFDRNGIRMISLDTNYHRSEEGTLQHYGDESAWEKCHQTGLLLSPEQMEFLRDSVATAPGPCVIFSHESAILPYGLINGPEIRAMLREAQGKHPVLWINGHHHRNRLQLTEGIAWFDLNSTTSVWVNKSHHAYPDELMKKCPVSDHELLYGAPVHAVVTVSEDGTFRIEGMSGMPYLGITPAMIGEPEQDRNGLPFDTNVLSAYFRLIV